MCVLQNDYCLTKSHLACNPFIELILGWNGLNDIFPGLWWRV